MRTYHLNGWKIWIGLTMSTCREGARPQREIGLRQEIRECVSMLYNRTALKTAGLWSGFSPTHYHTLTKDWYISSFFLLCIWVKVLQRVQVWKVTFLFISVLTILWIEIFWIQGRTIISNDISFYSNTLSQQHLCCATCKHTSYKPGLALHVGQEIKCSAGFFKSLSWIRKSGFLFTWGLQTQTTWQSQQQPGYLRACKSTECLQLHFVVGLVVGCCWQILVPFLLTGSCIWLKTNK